MIGPRNRRISTPTACNLANFMRTLALPDVVVQWWLTMLREKLVIIGAKIVRHGRYMFFQTAEFALPRELFADILRRTGPVPRSSAWGGSILGIPAKSVHTE